MNDQIARMYERMAQTGTAPDEGCVLFGVGYEDAYQRLKSKYLTERFKRGDSAEKFVVGPFGSGKTHFMRQLMELARSLDCVTAEVKLDKSVDFTKSLMVYREVTRSIRTPGGGRGMRRLLLEIRDRITGAAPDSNVQDALLDAWAAALDHGDIESPHFGKVARQAFRALNTGDDVLLDAAVRWLEGDISDRTVARELQVSTVPSGEQSHHANKSLYSLFQLIRHGGFAGTVLCFDEAEQGLEVNKKKTQQILSMFQTAINAIADLRNGSALILYGITPDIFEKMENFAALQQRVADPVPGVGFLDGDTFAPRIDLRQRPDDLADLLAIAERLVNVYHDHLNGVAGSSRESHLAIAADIAREVHESDVAAGNRRTLVKRTCSMLLNAQADMPAEVEAEV